MNKICCIIDCEPTKCDIEFSNFSHPLNRRYARKTAYLISYALKRGFNHYSASPESITEILDERIMVRAYMNPYRQSYDDLRHISKLIDYCDFVCFVCGFENRIVLDFFNRNGNRRFLHDYGAFLSVVDENGKTKILDETDYMLLKQSVIKD